MRCKFDDETLKLIALAIGTAKRKGDVDIEDHYLNYLVLKLIGEDGLSLDAENQEIYERLKAIVEKYEV